MEKSSRPVRNRRHSRRAYLLDSHRPIKRLFTPEIKRSLKDWLVRRRENPYPSRDEKKSLAVETGLTYTQICNWFANWRRKLKNSGREQKKTWGNLIKNYNTNAKGNVEQFSICSNDSIWGECAIEAINSAESLSLSPQHNISFENTIVSNSYYNHSIHHHHHHNVSNPELFSQQYLEYLQFQNSSTTGKINNETSITMIADHCYTPANITKLSQAQCFQISSTTDDINHIEQKIVNLDKSTRMSNPSFSNHNAANKYKNHIMEKYLRGLSDQKKHNNGSDIDDDNYDNNNNINYNSDKIDKNLGNGKHEHRPELSKWLQSTANFTPFKNNYIDWNNPRNKTEKKRSSKLSETDQIVDMSIHQKEELDAAEALTRLATNYRNKFCI